MSYSNTSRLKRRYGSVSLKIIKQVVFFQGIGDDDYCVDLRANASACSGIP